MMHKISHLGRRLWSFGLALAVLMAVAPTASASVFPTETFENELLALMQAQQADTEILARFQQQPSPLPWISTMNPLGGAFSYGTVEGATYGGKPFSLTASGTFDPTAQTGTWTSTASLRVTDTMTDIWIGTGSFSPSGLSFNDDEAAICFGCDEETDGILVINPNPPPDALCVGPPGTHPTCMPKLTQDGFPPILTFDSLKLTPGASAVQWSIEPTAPTNPLFSGFDLMADGTVDSTGNGTFTTRVVPAPEPGSAALVMSGIAILLGVGWARRSSRSFPPAAMRR